MKLNYKRTFLIGLAFLSISMFWTAYEGIIPLILKETFAVSDTWSGVIMALDNILALIMLPLFGALSDKTSTRIGRRMPYILFGTLSVCAFAVFIPIGAKIYSMPMFLISLMLVLLSMSIYRSPAVALMPDITPKPLRSKANAVINLMGAVGGIISLGLIAFLVPQTSNPDYIPLFVSIIVIMLICVGILFFTTHENELAAKCRDDTKEAKNCTASKLSGSELSSLIFLLASVFLWFFGYNAVTSAFSKYARVYWGLEGGVFAYTLIVAQAAAIISFIPAGMLATKIGRKKSILIGIGMLAVSLSAGFFFTSFSPLILGIFAIAGIGWAMINVNSYPMVVELSKSSDIGRYTGYYYTFSMLSQIVTPILSGAMLEFVGYHTLFPYAAFFVILSFVTMCFVRHGDTMPQKPKSNLELYNND